jgi:hypothetical protein
MERRNGNNERKYEKWIEDKYYKQRNKKESQKHTEADFSKSGRARVAKQFQMLR